MDRIGALKSMLEQDSGNSFARYGLAMEYMKSSRWEEAVAEFRTLIVSNPDYAAAYYQGGKALEQLQQLEEARAMYREGIAVTTRTGDAHTRSELQAALEFCGG